MKTEVKAFVLPVAIGVIVLASFGLLLFVWMGSLERTDVNKDGQDSTNVETANTTAADDSALENDSAAIDAEIRALESANSEVDVSFDDKSTI